jgi:maltooligosyltrehalose trehalohydrolase
VDTFRRSVLDWDEPAAEPHAGLLDWHRSLIALRRARPELTDPRLTAASVATGDGDAATGRWLTMRRGGVLVAANLGGGTVRLPVPGGGDRLLLASDPAIHMETGVNGDSKTPLVTLPGASAAVIG